MGLYLDIQTAVLSNMGRNNEATKAIVMTSFNTVQEFLYSSQQWPEFEIASSTSSLVVGDYEYDEELLLGSLGLSIYSLSLEDTTRRYPPLKYIVPNVWDEQMQSYSTIQTGRPRSWSRFGGTLSFDRKADVAYTLRVKGYSLVTAVTTESDSYQWLNKEGLLIAATTAIAWLSLEEPSLANSYLTLTKMLLSSAGVKANQIENFRPAVKDYKASSSSSGQPWADPFQRS